MHRLRLHWVLALALAAIGMVVIAPSMANAAPNNSNGCKAGTTPAATMAMYPAWPGDQSNLRVACIFSHVTGNDQVSPLFTIHDFANAVWHNGAGRTVTSSNVADLPIGTLAIPVANCTSMLTWINRPISTVGGVAGLKVYSTVTSVTGTCTAVTPTGTLNLNKSTNAVIHPGTVFNVENSDVRAVNDASIQAGAPNITSATANFQATDVGCSVSGTNFDDGNVTAFSITNPGGVLTTSTANTTPAPISTTSDALPSVNQTVTICGTKEVTTARTVNDSFETAANTLNSPSAKFAVSDVGLKISGTGITQPCFIQTRNSAALVTLSSACGTISAGPNTVTIGEPSATAPVNGDQVMNQGTQLPLNPALVAGSADCDKDSSEGFIIQATWLNPGSFQGGAFATQPLSPLVTTPVTGTQAIGELFVKTSAGVNYGAYVIQMPVGSGDGTTGALHYNVVFPNVPTGLALCPSTATSPGLGLSIGINGTTVSQALIPPGTGRPGTSQLRATRFSTTGSTSTIFLTDDNAGPGVNWTGPNFNRLCGPIPAGPADLSPPNGFICGAG